MEKEDVKELQVQYEGIDAYRSLEIKTDEDMAAVSDKVKEVIAFRKRAEEEKKKLTDPARQIIAQAGETYDPFIARAKDVEVVLKSKGVAYVTAKNAAIAKDEKRITDAVERGGRGGLKVETGLKKLEVLPEQKKTVSTDFSGFQVKEVRDVEVVDEKLIPDEFWDRTLNRRRLYAAVVTAKLVVPGAKMIIKNQGASV